MVSIEFVMVIQILRNGSVEIFLLSLSLKSTQFGIHYVLRREKRSFIKHKCPDLLGSKNGKTAFSPFIRSDFSTANIPAEKTNIFGLFFTLIQFWTTRAMLHLFIFSEVLCPPMIYTFDGVYRLLRSINVKKGNCHDIIPLHNAKKRASQVAQLFPQLYPYANYIPHDYKLKFSLIIRITQLFNLGHKE